ncbi:MAG: TetR family transcriptional regulator, partial [Alphaproteobacteria bacterium]
MIASALDILKDGTLADLSLRALARKAGVSQTAPYRHFEDKEALIAVLKEEGMRKLGEGMKA